MAGHITIHHFHMPLGRAGLINNVIQLPCCCHAASAAEDIASPCFRGRGALNSSEESPKFCVTAGAEPAAAAAAAADVSAGDDLADIRAGLAVVQLPSCMDDPSSLGNAAMARLKRTAEKVGAALTYQVIAPLRLLLLDLCGKSDKAWGADIHMQDEVGERCGVLRVGKTFCAAPRTVSAVRGLLFGVTTWWEACNSAAAAHMVEVLSPASPRCGHHSNAGYCMGVSRCSIKLPHKLLPAGRLVDYGTGRQCPHNSQHVPVSSCRRVRRRPSLRCHGQIWRHWDRNRPTQNRRCHLCNNE